MDDTFHRVEEHLLKVSVARHRAILITSETELYRDLRMYGDVLFFDLALWAERKFGVEPNLRVGDYGPGEWPFGHLFRLLARLVGKKEQKYKSLKVRDVITAIETKRWPE
jgi:hypothetical protein